MINDFSLPDELEFGPAGTDCSVALQVEDDVALHRQLVCWCNVQRYMYYILRTPGSCVDDEFYDAVCSYVREMEEDCSYLENAYSPTKRMGGMREVDYPWGVREMFRE